uniref:40S ribosomal protein S3 n=1 Tax=Macrostomum lignano TaxID=282301 RepID=A0A1I8IBA8_9PLAT
AESLRYKLLGGLAVRRACYGVLRFIMESGAKGAEVIVSGKLRGQRAKSMKFTEGFMIHSGEPSVRFIDRSPLPDHVTIADPKEQPVPAEPYSENKQQKPQAEVMAVA